MDKKRLKLKTEAEYEAAMCQLDTFWDAVPGSPDEEYLDMVARAIEAYEEKHYPCTPLIDRMGTE